MWGGRHMWYVGKYGICFPNNSFLIVKRILFSSFSLCSWRTVDHFLFYNNPLHLGRLLSCPSFVIFFSKLNKLNSFHFSLLTCFLTFHFLLLLYFSLLSPDSLHFGDIFLNGYCLKMDTVFQQVSSLTLSKAQ